VEQFIYHHLTFEERQTMIAQYLAVYIMDNQENEHQWDLFFKNDLNISGREEAKENGMILYKITSDW
jgi:hypothetical protein